MVELGREQRAEKRRQLVESAATFGPALALRTFVSRLADMDDDGCGQLPGPLRRQLHLVSSPAPGVRKLFELQTTIELNVGEAIALLLLRRDVATDILPSKSDLAVLPSKFKDVPTAELHQLVLDALSRHISED
jgi:hypothetical protein